MLAERAGFMLLGSILLGFIQPRPILLAKRVLPSDCGALGEVALPPAG